ncbi:MAG: aminomethyl-transferring glycine dehydrogenase subunit GcvPA [Spirochaetales bacterium]|nr:aminomethyl-transferring glycine dehydrogenase subunit GcvPA [Spirochaetales bacterium]
MRYLSHSSNEIEYMLGIIGKKSIDELFDSIPKSLQLEKGLNLPKPISEWELESYFNKISKDDGLQKSYLGGGIYNHFIPSIIPYLTSRSEFLTSYTPYQPEISQGTLQTQFEFQTYISTYLGMDYSNSSMYDGATSFVEGVLLSVRVNKSKKVAVSMGINPHYLDVLKTYSQGADLEIIYLELNKDGKTDLDSIENISELASISIQSPNYFGVIEDQEKVKPIIGSNCTLFISVFTEILSFGLFQPPGFYNADLACGEAQSFGLSQNYGGPCLGIFGFKKDFLRAVPGRLVGQTIDKNGNRSFSLTLATREQHIRREKATSNICSNQGLCVVSATIYMSLLGGEGLKRLASINFSNSEYLKKGLINLGCSLKYESETFNEFLVKFPKTFDMNLFKKYKIIPGYKIDEYYLITVTEVLTKIDMDEFLLIVREGV